MFMGAAIAMLQGGRPVLKSGRLRADAGTPHRIGHSQRGQVLLPAIVLTLVSAAFMYLMINSSQAVNEKMRLTNAADAAAYSAAVVEARSLNYQAYMNRAMVANEIAIAQSLSMASWLKYFANAVDEGYPSAVADINFFLLPDPDLLLDLAQIELVFTGTAYAMAEMGTTANQWADIIAQGLLTTVPLFDIVTQALSASQTALQVSLLAGVQQGQTARDVVDAIDSRMRAEVVLPTHGFDQFTRSYARRGAGGDERARFADVVTRSRDLFTRERNWSIGPSTDIPLIRQDGELKKRAGTDLVGFDEWRAIDTLEQHGERFGCGRFGLSWCDDIRKPVGWGGAFASNDGRDHGAGRHGNAYRANRTTARQAEQDMYEASGFSGLPDSRDLARLEADAVLSTAITVMVSKSHRDLSTSGGNARARPSGALALFNDRPAGATMVALSRASVYFDRVSPRTDGKTEIASLYNPYWRVRLVAPTTEDRAYAAARQEGLLLP